jgi:hypothetical protein
MRIRPGAAASLLAACVLCSIPGAAFAQSVGIVNGNARIAGGSPAPIYVTFAAGATAVASYSLTVSYMSGLFVTPTVSTCFANANCTVNAGAGTISVVRTNPAPVALQSENACLLVFTSTAGSSFGIFPLTITNAQATDPNGDAITLGTQNGSVGIISGGGEPPRLSYLPTFDADCATDPVAEVRFPDASGPTTASINLTATPGSTSAEPLVLACTAPNGISIVSGGNQMLQGAAIANPIALRCDSPSPQNRTLICTETTTNGRWFRHWDLACTGPVFADGFEGAPAAP